ncbi:unnamed protein product, partial [Brugia timori]
MSFRRFTELGYVIELNETGLRISDPKTNECLLTGIYISPSWIIQLELIPYENIETELDKYKYETENTNSQTLQLGNIQHTVKDTEISSTEQVNSDYTHTSKNSDDDIQTDKINIETNKDRMENETTPQLQGDSKNDLEKEIYIRQVNPKVDSTISGLDQPVLNDYSGNNPIQIIDVEKSNDTIDEMTVRKYKNKPTIGYLWHVRLGHASIRYLLELQKKDSTLKGVIFDQSITECDTCALTKLTKLPFVETRMRAVRPLQIIHTDLMGPIKPMTFPGNQRFIVVFVDDYSRLAMAYAMKSKDETGFYLERFLISSRNMLGKNEKVCYLQSDKGTEFTGGYTKALLDRENIEQKLAPPNTPQHNGVAERFNRTLLSKMRAMLLD